MLSYQHAYHAGGPADLHKHAALAALIALLTEKERGITYLESHAGRALYDLDAPEALKTGEAAQGIGRVRAPKGPYKKALETCWKAHGKRSYPGSPLIAKALLRPQDTMQLCELHPAEHDALKALLPNTAVHKRDGHEGLRALTPPKLRRGLVMIDPSYEVKDEYARTLDTAATVLRRWPEGSILVWYPLLPDMRQAQMADDLGRLPGALRDEVAFRAPPERGMQGSGLVLVNAPFGANKALAAGRESFPDLFRSV